MDRVTAPTQIDHMAARRPTTLAGWAIALSGVIVLGAELDVPIFVGVPTLLMAVAAGTCWVSARRAAHGDPMAALRQQ
jgi:hypothetical protein